MKSAAGFIRRSVAVMIALVIVVSTFSQFAVFASDDGVLYYKAGQAVKADYYDKFQSSNRVFADVRWTVMRESDIREIASRNHTTTIRLANNAGSGHVLMVLDTTDGELAYNALCHMSFVYTKTNAKTGQTTTYNCSPYTTIQRGIYAGTGRDCYIIRRLTPYDIDAEILNPEGGYFAGAHTVEVKNPMHRFSMTITGLPDVKNGPGVPDKTNTWKFEYVNNRLSMPYTIKYVDDPRYEFDSVSLQVECCERPALSNDYAVTHPISYGTGTVYNEYITYRSESHIGKDVTARVHYTPAPTFNFYASRTYKYSFMGLDFKENFIVDAKKNAVTTWEFSGSKYKGGAGNSNACNITLDSASYDYFKRRYQELYDTRGSVPEREIARFAVYYTALDFISALNRRTGNDGRTGFKALPFTDDTYIFVTIPSKNYSDSCDLCNFSIIKSYVDPSTLNCNRHFAFRPSDMTLPYRPNKPAKVTSTVGLKTKVEIAYFHVVINDTVCYRNGFVPPYKQYSGWDEMTDIFWRTAKNVVGNYKYGFFAKSCFDNQYYGNWDEFTRNTPWQIYERFDHTLY